ncbi:putative protease eep protein [Marine Group I thaumarchaeote SCGC AAA799-E16]|uniref:Zinc metalloprotease RasP protein n=2 Tax=Marine Group I TaxID=905826 RepID=A0A087S3C9_9ARCH|nr:putative protease eep protein [Marine Group I thaumarchaeote SCGC AAA799-E16]KFM20233.1 Zinc metalloprotease RasP protein [Marine Group I thaumarchaeote SCGC RSA3]
MITTGFIVTDKCPYLKKITTSLELDFITQNSIIYVLMAWVIIVIVAKGLKLEKHGFEIKAYSLTYKNKQVNSVLLKLLSRTRRGIRVFADVSVISGFIMMGFAFWFLLNNVANFFVAQTEFSELTVLIPGVTLTSAASITYFLLSIPVVLVIHEGAHGIVAALEKIKIKTGGFAIFIAMFAGFVEPDEEEFNKAKKISKLRVIGAGATSNVIFAFVLGAILLTNPFFAMVLPEPLLSTFYELPEGVLILSIIENSGAEQAGLLANDIITSINDKPILSPVDFPILNPGDMASVSVLRDGQPLEFSLEVMPAPDDPERGLIGIMRDNSFAYKPVMNFIEWNDPNLSMFLLWLWMISFFIGIINMLPLPILDGGKFIHTIIDKRISEKAVNGVMWGIYAFTFALFGLNIALSYVKSGWFTI